MNPFRQTRIVKAWGFSQEEALRALATPEAVSDLYAATVLLERYVRQDRIGLVISRPADALGDGSLRQLALEGQHSEVRRSVTRMFELPHR